jgi:hypothetical protein
MPALPAARSRSLNPAAYSADSICAVRVPINDSQRLLDLFLKGRVLFEMRLMSGHAFLVAGVATSLYRRELFLNGFSLFS